MYDVLLGIGPDDEQRATAMAEAVAGLPAADRAVRAHLCHVFGDNPEGASVDQIGTVRRAREVLEDADVTYVYHEASGNPADELMATADEVDADAICVSGRRRSPTGKAMFGSTTQTLVLNADRPILTAPSSGRD